MPPLRLFAVIGWLALAGCRPSEAPRPSDSTYIAAMIELRKLSPGTDSATRAAVLQRHGVTLAELERTARELARDPARAAKVWEAIDRPEAGGRPDSTGGRARRAVPGLK